MSLKKGIIICLALGSLFFGGWYFYKFYFKKNNKPPYTTQKPTRQDIKKIVDAEGMLEALEYSKVGPLISGTVQKIYVQEDERVAKGTLLATLDNGLGGDTAVREQEALLAQAQSAWNYLDKNYQRQKALFQSGQLAKDAFEKITDTWNSAQAEVKKRQAILDREKYIYASTQITAPISGTILSIGVKEGESVSTTSPPTVLFELANKLENMKVSLEIEESKIGDVIPGQKAIISVDPYPTNQWTCTVGKTGHSARAKAKQGQGSTLMCYKVEAIIANPDHLLLPGMSAHAKISVAEKLNALTLPCHVLQMPKEHIKALAHKMKWEYKPLGQDEKKRFELRNPNIPLQSIWKVEKKSFIETIVKTGIATGAVFEITEGIMEHDDIVTDIEETDAMKDLYKKMLK